MLAEFDAIVALGVVMLMLPVFFYHSLYSERIFSSELDAYASALTGSMGLQAAALYLAGATPAQPSSGVTGLQGYSVAKHIDPQDCPYGSRLVVAGGSVYCIGVIR